MPEQPQQADVVGTTPRRSLLTCGLALAAPGVLAQPRRQPVTTVIYPAPESPQDIRSIDMVELLRAALERTQDRFGPFELKSARESMTQSRQFRELEAGERLSVLWTTSTAEKEERLLPVRFPTRRGILGYRLLLVRKQSLARFESVAQPADLARFVFGQGAAWVDTRVLQSQGIKVETAHYEPLFQMLELGRIDAFPRGINEIFDELLVRSGIYPSLVIEPTLALHYRMPFYFFVNKREVALAARITAGLWAMWRDGSFERHFYKFHGAALRQANLGGRRVIELPNPFAPGGLPPPDSPLWFDPKAPLPPA